MTERAKFLARFADKKATGLVDMKFFVKPGETLSEDDFFTQANHIDDYLGKNQANGHGDLTELDAKLRQA